MLVWVAVAFIVALSVVGIYQRMHASQVTLSVTRSMAGELALSLGQSVLEEAMHQVRLQVNEPASPLFHQFRRPVPAPQAGSFQITKYVNATESSLLLERPTFNRFSFTGPQAEVLYQRQFEDLPYERFGVVHYWTRVAGAVGSSDTIVREVHAYQDFRTVLITTPRPFDELPFYVGRASALTDLVAANRHRLALLELYRQAREALVRAHDATPAGSIKTNFAQMLTSARDVPDIERSSPALPEDPDAHVTAVWQTGQSFTLETMDLARRLGEAVPKAQRAAATQAQSLTGVLGQRGDPSAANRFMADTSEVLNILLKEMLRIWGFQNAFLFVPSGTPEYQVWEQKAQARLSYEHFRKLAFFILREEKGGGPEKRIQAQWERLLKRVQTPTGQPQPLNGVVLVENETEPLVLKGELHGKLIVVATRGGLVLDNLNVRDNPDESLVAVCLGGLLDVTGQINAVLVASPYRAGSEVVNPRVRMSPDVQINGGLFLPEGVSLADWRGVLSYDDKYYGGPITPGSAGWPDHYYVGVSPRTVFRSVIRK